MKTRRRVLILLAALLVASGAWWTFDSRRRVAPERLTTPRADNSAPPPSSEDPSQLAVGAHVPDAKRGGLVSPGPSPDESPKRPTMRIQGRVRMPHGDVPDGAIVYVAGRVGRSTRYLGRARPGRDGAFEIDASAPDGKEIWYVRVGTWIDGFPRVEKSLDVTPGTALDVVLDVPDGAHLAGRVIGEDGQPVAGLRVAIAQTIAAGLFKTGHVADPAHDEEQSGRESEIVTATTTDADGRFDVSGLDKQSPYVPASTDDRWWLEANNNGTVRPIDGFVAVTAHPAFRVDVEVVAAAVDDPTGTWPSMQVALETLTPAPQPFAGIGTPWTPTVTFRGPIPAEARSGFSVRVRADTRLHRSTETAVALGPTVWSQRVRIALERKSRDEIGSIAVDAGLKNADGTPFFVRLRMKRQTGERQWTHDVVQLSAREDGTFLGSVPTGRHEFGLEVEVPFKTFAVWKGDLEIAVGRETPFRVPWPAHGRVRIRLGSERVPIGNGTVTLESADRKTGATWTGPAKTAEIWAPIVPVGTWTAIWQTGVRRPGDPLPKATFDVVAGEQVTVDLVP